MNLGDVFESSPRLSATPEFEISAKEREELLQRRDAERARIEEADHLARKNKMELEIASVKHKVEPAKLFLTEMRVQLSQETNEWTKRTLVPPLNEETASEFLQACRTSRSLESLPTAASMMNLPLQKSRSENFQMAACKPGWLSWAHLLHISLCLATFMHISI
ncbi:hypothetical protein HDU98_007096 [Podochytrium sp. JEL0797]|nr:hypothetical protein HDU98_007096 [Podochytrium sp. JEL0797]